MLSRETCSATLPAILFVLASPLVWLGCSSSSGPSSNDAGPHDAAADVKSSDVKSVDVATQTDVTIDVPPFYTLTVSVTGGGSVASSDGKIQCPSMTCSASYPTGVQVMLAETSSSGSAFSSWSGGGCMGTPSSCTVTLSSDTTVTATFATPATWDPKWTLDADGGAGDAGAQQIIFTNGDLSIAAPTASNTYNVRATVGETSGKWYWEVTATAGSPTSNSGGLGILGPGTPQTADYIGYTGDGLSFGYSIYNPEFFYSWGSSTAQEFPGPANTPVAAGNVYMFALDLDDDKLYAGVNGTWFSGDDAGTSIMGPPTAAPIFTGITTSSGKIYPGVTFYPAPSSGNAFTGNFGGSPFMYSVPAGFHPGVY
jgi:hypothetical protein